MAPTTKESAPPLPVPQGQRAAAQNAGAPAGPRKDAIGIEIPVVLYASRNSSAARSLSKAPPPVREETHTVIVFPQGAVVRLSASISVGEMVVLTNQQTGADVLCRVAAVKAQPGIQNYVDLEFTQRAPGFWGANSAADSQRLASAPPVRAVATAPIILTPAAQPSFVPSAASEPVSPAPAALPISVPAPAATSVPPWAAEPLRPTPPRPAAPFVPASPALPVAPAVPSVAHPVSGLNAGLRMADPGLSTLTGGRADWTQQAAPISKKGLWAAIAAVVVAGIVAGGFFLYRRQQSTLRESGVTITAPSAPAQPAASDRADEPPAPVAEGPAPSTAAAPAQRPSWLPETPKHEQLQAEKAPQPAQAAQSAPRRPAIPIGKLSAPIPKRPITVSSSEPPPMLLTQNSTAADGILRTGELSGVSRAEAPTAFAPAENSPAQPVPPVLSARPPATAGQMETPKLIASPNPLYPAAARAQSLEGVVTLDALVDAAGNVAEVKALSGPMLLRQAAIDALRRWKYQPARLNGLPTSTHMQVNIAFKLH
jgi:protein TonB